DRHPGHGDAARRPGQRELGGGHSGQVHRVVERQTHVVHRRGGHTPRVTDHDPGAGGGGLGLVGGGGGVTPADTRQAPPVAGGGRRGGGGGGGGGSRARGGGVGGRGGWVSVGPPLSASGPSRGSIGRSGLPIRLPPMPLLIPERLPSPTPSRL